MKSEQFPMRVVFFPLPQSNFSTIAMTAVDRLINRALELLPNAKAGYVSRGKETVSLEVAELQNLTHVAISTRHIFTTAINPISGKYTIIHGVYDVIVDEKYGSYHE